MAKKEVAGKQSWPTGKWGLRLGNKRKVKDVLFRAVFGENKKALLELYNLLNGTDYTDTEGLEIVTIEDAFFITYKNDVAYVFSGVISLYEHQSTVNPNMPVRFLIYISEEYQKIVGLMKKDIYGKSLISLPTPKCVVFYNGEQDAPDVQEIQLSDAFSNKEVAADLQLKVTVININYGHNKEMMDRCATLEEYAHFVNILRDNAAHYDINTAGDVTIEYCIEHGILADFLKEKKSEVLGMILRDFDRKKYEYTLKEDAREEGREEGREVGREEGREEGRTELLIAQIHDGEISIESAAKRMNMTPDEFGKRYLE